MAAERDQSAVVVLVPDAEPLVSRWRQQFERSAAQGMPAHITILYPFLDESRLTAAVLAELAALCARQPATGIEFRRLLRFSGVLYLDPEPAEGLRRLTLDIVARWPEAPPYGGLHDEIVPHLTVASGVPDATAAEIERDVGPRLPLRTRVEEAWVSVFDGERWRQRTRLPFG